MPIGSQFWASSELCFYKFCRMCRVTACSHGRGGKRDPGNEAGVAFSLRLDLAMEENRHFFENEYGDLSSVVLNRVINFSM